jgi:hypothetical protein
MSGDSDDVELRHKGGESLELQTSAQSQSTTVTVSPALVPMGLAMPEASNILFLFSSRR